jgi:hypothetical protein
VFAEIDWDRPWFGTVRPAASGMDLGGASVIAEFNRIARALALHNHRGLPLQFVPQADLPEGRAYEEFIGAEGKVPTRDNLHDFFNGLVWLSFPRIKQQLNALQAAQIARDGIGKSRGPARDAATIFDENAALLVLRDNAEGAALEDALRNHRWNEAFVERAGMFGRDAQVWLFGHALMEKLVAPYKAITAHTRIVRAPDHWFESSGMERCAWIDETVATQLAEEGLSNAGFTPLPVLGIPGWWPQQDKEFYDDATVFRPRRKAAA